MYLLIMLKIWDLVDSDKLSNEKYVLKMTFFTIFVQCD